MSRIWKSAAIIARCVRIVLLNITLHFWRFCIYKQNHFPSLLSASPVGGGWNDKAKNCNTFMIELLVYFLYNRCLQILKPVKGLEVVPLQESPLMHYVFYRILGTKTYRDVFSKTRFSALVVRFGRGLSLQILFIVNSLSWNFVLLV